MIKTRLQIHNFKLGKDLKMSSPEFQIKMLPLSVCSSAALTVVLLLIQLMATRRP